MEAKAIYRLSLDHHDEQTALSSSLSIYDHVPLGSSSPSLSAKVEFYIEMIEQEPSREGVAMELVDGVQESTSYRTQITELEREWMDDMGNADEVYDVFTAHSTLDAKSIYLDQLPTFEEEDWMDDMKNVGVPPTSPAWAGSAPQTGSTPVVGNACAESTPSQPTSSLSICHSTSLREMSISISAGSSAVNRQLLSKPLAACCVRSQTSIDICHSPQQMAAKGGLSFFP
ncbi:hypothetical protein C8Q75DRAFT_807158 [Abortiporus biennis]|nr:hypothetical protein C8Q75DRAFT_807158 [Abortiporus biennis]